VCEVNEFREGGDKGRYICRGVEEWWVLFDKKVLHLPRAILGCLILGWPVLRVLDLRLIVELLFFASHWVDDWWKEGLRAVWHMERERLYVAAYPRERLYARRLGECRGLKGRSDGLEQLRRSARREVMTDKTEVGKVFWLQVLKQVVATCVVEPKAQED
jgi:hypothetical protein